MYYSLEIYKFLHILRANSKVGRYSWRYFGRISPYV